MDVIARTLKSKEEFEKGLFLSVSKTKTFDDCKAKYKFCYIDNLPRKQWDFHIFGLFLHQILEGFHANLISDPSLEKNWEGLLDDEFKKVRNNEDFKDKVTPDQLADGTEIINTYKKILKEEGLPNIISVEKSFYISLNDRILLNGFIDRIQDDDGVLHVSDYKTTKNKKYLKDFFQLMTYAYVLMVENPELEKIKASFILLRHDFEYITKEYTRKEVMSTADKFIKYADDIESEKLWRPNPQFLCKYCDYREQCTAGTDYLVKKGVIEGKEKQYKVGLVSW